MKKLKVFFKWGSVLLILTFLLIGAALYHSKYSLETTHYSIYLDDSQERDPVRIVQLTDLHNAFFGEHNERLIAEVAEQEPDVIFITGDLVDSHKVADTKQAQELIPKLVEIAPVYISLGNQEMDLINRLGLDVVSDYESTGATVLDFSYVDLELKGQKYRIGGIYGYCQPVIYAMEGQRDNESAFLMDFQDTDACKLLLCHMPLSWVDSYSLYDWDVDAVFSGHVHGGQVRIPFVGGLWAPDHGWFPGKLCGVYTTDYEGWVTSREKLLRYAKKRKYDISYYEEHDEYKPSYLVLSRGLGNTDWVPRFNNVPEIVVVDLYSGEDL